MINFRFHLVSLIAVFLALAVGVVMGYGVLGQPTVDGLQNRVDTVEARADRIKAENGRLRQDNDRLDRAVRELGDFAVTDRLVGVTVVPVAVRGVDETRMEEAVLLARRAGATVPGIVWLERRWGLPEPDDASGLAAVLGVPDTSRAAVREAAARALAARITGAPSPPGRPDVLDALVTADFVAVGEVGGLRFAPASLDGRAARVLLVSGTEAEIDPAHGVLLLARDLAASGTSIVVADDWRDRDGGPTRGEALRVIRDDADLRSRIATLDQFDQVDGPLGAVLVLAELGQGVVGHYGSGDGADRTLPAWWDV